MNRIYGTYRMKYTNTGVRYSPSYFLDKQYEDYLTAGLTKMLDMDISDEQYTSELVPGVKKMTRFITGEYNADFVQLEDFKANINRVGAEFGIEIFSTVEEARQWLRDNTSLTELSPGVFEIHPEYNDPLTGLVPQRTLTVE